ncbi:MAG: glutamate--cysteine ligase [Burkholderiaceae bacterium]|nr:glutamate--cysteine ligase [Burkholderiaceae bacterium]
MVPHLVTAMSVPLRDFEQRILDATARIERWFRLEWQDHTPPFYASVDLRNAGFKLAPVDTNLFPGGFDNLSPEMLPLAVQAAMAAIEKYCPNARNLLLIPESHTRNAWYLHNVQRLSMILGQTGLNVRLGTLDPAISRPTRIEVPDAPALTLEPLVRNGNRAGLRDFDPCAILLNNDLSAGIPPVLENLREQVVLPPLHAGWAVRRKSQHFAAYADVAKRFARELGLDPWLINPYFARCGRIDFHAREGEDCLVSHVETLLRQVRSKYREYGISEKPFVVIKADAGTYGMGVMSVHDAAEVRSLNHTQRSRMAVVKEGLEVREVMLQEGVHTFETVNGDFAEPVVYMIDRYVVGGFYRVHEQRASDENLNAPGMRFVPLPFASSCHVPDCNASIEHAPNRFYVYGVVARLALLAASIELEQTDPDPSRYG